MAELNVSKKTVKEFFTGIGKNKFIIPDFQRPYAWNTEKCETLWLDIVDAYQKYSDQKDSEKDYFLGTIVSYKNKENENIEIIDGQQRITTLMLLLRAFYKKIEGADKGNIQGLKNSIESCIWKKDDLSGEKDPDDIHLESEVATDEQKTDMMDIIKYGDCERKKSKYYENYTIFINESDKYASDNPINDQWKQLCLFVMEHCIVLPIECDNQEIALTIFQTINDRGLPLSNADIIKARIYQSRESKEDKNKFIEDWKTLTDICAKAKITLDDIFRYYSHIIRAEEDNKSKEIGLRKFYFMANYEKLNRGSLINDLIKLAKFWYYVNLDNKYDDEYAYEISDGAKKWLHCFNKYPNEYWKYICSVFFYYQHTNKDFDRSLENLLKQSVQFLFLKFIQYPSVNAIKEDIYKACINIKNKKELLFDKIKESINDELNNKLQNPPPKLIHSLLLVHAYLNPQQEIIIKEPLHIEHILPRKWQEANYRGWNKEDADEYIEKFGNKVICEFKINIQAGNDYFGQKKKKYVTSDIVNVKKLAKHNSNDWGKEDIEKRQKEVANELKNFFFDN